MRVIRYALLSLALIVLFSGCTANKQFDERLAVPQQQANEIDFALETVANAHQAQNYQRMVDVLKDVVANGYVYHRADEILYWIGVARVNMLHADQAMQAFATLRDYYPWIEGKYPDLVEWEELAQRMIRDRQEAASDADEIINSLDDSAWSDDGTPLVSNSFFDSDLRMVLADLTADTGVRIIADPQVSGFVTADFYDVPLEEVLEQILLPNGFTYRNMGDYYLVGDASTSSPSFATMSETRRFPLRYLRTSQLEALLPDVFIDYVRFDHTSNTITITASPIMVDRLSIILDEIDVLPTQFLIEVEVLEMSKELERSLGLNWDFIGTKSDQSFVFSQLAPDSLVASLLGEVIATGESGPEGFTVDRRTAINALADNGLVKVLANPRLSTQQGQAATIRVGKEAYFNLLGNSGTYITSNALEKISTGVTLSIVPFRGENAQITTDLDVEVSDVLDPGTGGLPVTSVRQVTTRSTVANGNTLGVGGLLLENDRKSRSGIPGLSEIPVLGYLFGQTTTESVTTEVVILITPHVLLPPDLFRDL